jgi:hypothetical protein
MPYGRDDTHHMELPRGVRHVDSADLYLSARQG